MIDDLTICITSFRRPERLKRCIESVKAAGVDKIVVAEGDEYGPDVGCNNTWLLAAYRSTTKRIILLHDDDQLCPEFGEAYQSIIKPVLDERKAGFVSWQPAIIKDDGRRIPCPYWGGVSTLMPSYQLLTVVDAKGQLSLSPIVSVLNRTVLIRACKEAGEYLTKNDSLERPGMLLGTEIVVYMRHIQTFKRWLYLDKVLSLYGHHEGSGTVKAQQLGKEMMLAKGYDLARDHARNILPEPTPRIIFVHSKFQSKNEETQSRMELAQRSWRWHFRSADMIEMPFEQEGFPKLRDLLDYGCTMALPEDIVVYANADAGLTTAAFERIVEGVKRGNGVTCCGGRNIQQRDWVSLPPKSVTNGKANGGIELIAMTPQWWKIHRDKMPDMYIGREGWDTCFSALAEEWADGRCLEDISNSDLWPKSKAHTDNVVWHNDHKSDWQNERFEGQNQHNRELALKFFSERGHAKALEVLK